MIDRVACEHAHECAGCPLIDWTYDAQLDAKRERVKASVALYPALDGVVVETTAPAEPISGYRVRAKFIVGPPSNGGAAPPVLGLFARANQGAKDHRVIDIPGCQVLAPSLKEVAAGLRRLLANPPVEAGGCLVPEGSGGFLSALDLREVKDDEAAVLVTLVLTSAAGVAEGELAAAARAVKDLSPMIVGVAANYRAPGAVQVLGPTTRRLFGPASVRDRTGSSYRLASYGSFTQVHRGQAAWIEAWIAAHSGNGAPQVLDLYGGSGALSLSLARLGAKVTLIESYRPAAECAERAAKEQGFQQFVVRTGDVATLLPQLSNDDSRFDVVIANPPRRGMSPVVRGAIAALEPRSIAYVSCDPETLCRDLDHLARLGYGVENLRPVDMIPLTDQVEIVALLRPAKRAQPQVPFEDDEIFVLERHAHDPPSPRGDRFGEGRVSACGAPATSGLVIGAKSSSSERVLRSALAGSHAARTSLILCCGATAREGRVQGRTHYERLAKIGGHSLVRVTVTGDRDAQIESDMARAGHPVIGDTGQGHRPTNRYFEEKYGLDRPFFHCFKIEFDHPQTGTHVVAKSTLPGELTMVLGRLGSLALDVAKEVMVG